MEIVFTGLVSSLSYDTALEQCVDSLAVRTSEMDKHDDDLIDIGLFDDLYHYAIDKFFFCQMAYEKVRANF